MDATLRSRVVQFAAAREAWSRDQSEAKTKAVRGALEDLVKRAALVWSDPKYPAAFREDLAALGLEALANLPPAFYDAKASTEALLRLAVIEKTRARLDAEDETPVDLGQALLPIAALQPQLLLFAMATGLITPEDLVDNAKKVARVAGELGDKGRQKLDEAASAALRWIALVVGLAVVIVGALVTLLVVLTRPKSSRAAADEEGVRGRLQALLDKEGG